MNNLSNIEFQKRLDDLAKKVSREIMARQRISKLKTSKKNKKRMMKHMMEKLYSKEPKKFWVDDIEDK